MSMAQVLGWMHDHDRTIGYVASRSGIVADRVIGLLAVAAPTDDEAAAVSELTGIPAEDLQRSGPDRGSAADLDPLRCYKVAEVAALLSVSADTVRTEIKSGALGSLIFGARAHRIPRAALERRLTTPERARDGR